MSSWKDLGRTLYPDELRTLIRDACALLGKCNADTPPPAILAKSPNQLLFDIPPLTNRPNHQKEALVYIIVLLLNDANVYISPADFPKDYYSNKPADALESSVNDIGNAQEYPAR